jgi:hypothetical protein
MCSKIEFEVIIANYFWEQLRSRHPRSQSHSILEARPYREIHSSISHVDFFSYKLSQFYLAKLAH